MDIKGAINLSKKGILLKLHVMPGSFQSVFPSGYNEWRRSIEIKVKAEAKENKANNEVIHKIAEYLDISEKDICIVSGEKIREKTILIKDLSIGKICKKLEESLNGLQRVS